MNEKTRDELLKTIGELLDSPGVVVRIQRELEKAPKRADKKNDDRYVSNCRVNIIISGKLNS